MHRGSDHTHNFVWQTHSNDENALCKSLRFVYLTLHITNLLQAFFSKRPSSRKNQPNYRLAKNLDLALHILIHFITYWFSYRSVFFKINLTWRMLKRFFRCSCFLHASWDDLQVVKSYRRLNDTIPINNLPIIIVVNAILVFKLVLYYLIVILIRSDVRLLLSDVLMLLRSSSML